VYARPAFVRVTTELPLTSTFKHQKASLVREGYDFTKWESRVVPDDIFFYTCKTGVVVHLVPNMLLSIENGDIKV
jgi:hypothetical protein